MDSSITHIRPRFKIKVPYNSDLLLNRISQILQNNPDKIKGKITDEHVILDIIKENQHYWSPQLNFRVESDEDNPEASILSGIIGPKPSVWTLFMFVYFIIGVCGFFISSIGISRWMLGEYTWWLLAIPIALLLMLSAYKVGKYGEYLAKDQIELLKQFIRDAVKVR